MGLCLDISDVSQLRYFEFSKYFGLARTHLGRPAVDAGRGATGPQAPISRGFWITNDEMMTLFSTV